MDGWVSPLLGISFDMSGDELQIFGSDGQRFLSYLEVTALRDQDQRARQRAQKQAEEAARKAERLAAQLRAMGIDPEA